MSTNKKEYSNLEEINKENILNFGSLSKNQHIALTIWGSKGKRGEAQIKCKGCKNRRKVKWESAARAWNINDKDEVNKGETDGGGGIWKVYLCGAQVEKTKSIYQVVSEIEFYCAVCDWRHNQLWLKQ